MQTVCPTVQFARAWGTAEARDLFAAVAETSPRGELQLTEVDPAYDELGEYDDLGNIWRIWELIAELRANALA